MKLFWVPEHGGIVENEQADKLTWLGSYHQCVSFVVSLIAIWKNVTIELTTGHSDPTKN